VAHGPPKKGALVKVAGYSIMQNRNGVLKGWCYTLEFQNPSVQIFHASRIL